LSQVACPLQAEALAAIFSLQRAIHLGMTKIILKTDASVLGHALDSEEMDHGTYGALFRQIRELMRLHFSVYKISMYSTVCIKVADCIAFYGAFVVASGSHVFMSQVPDFVSDVLSRDKPGMSY
jgi:hypothetical protein